MSKNKNIINEKKTQILNNLKPHSKSLSNFLWVILIVVGLVFAYHYFKTDKIPQTINAESRVLERSVTVTGKLEQANEINATFQQSGMIKNIYVRVGQRVSPGKLLAQLDLGTLLSDELEARSNIDLAELDKIKNSQDKDLKEKSLSQDEILARENIITLSRKLLSADLMLKLADNSSSSNSAPLISGTFDDVVDSAEYKIQIYSSSSGSGLSAIYSGYESGTVELSQYKAFKLGTKGLFIQLPVGFSRDLAGTTWTLSLPNTSSAQYVSNLYQLVEAKKNYDEVIRNKKNTLVLQNVTSNGKNSYDIALDRAYAQLARISDLKRLKGMYSPLSGIVGKVDISVGDQATAGGEGITILGGTSFIVNLKVPETSIGGVEVGSSVELEIDSLPDMQFEGIVNSINTAVSYIDGTPVYETKVIIKKPNKNIRSGMNATGRIIIDEYDASISVPDTVIQYNEETKKNTVKIYNELDKKIVDKDVTILFRSSDGYVALEGITLDDNIIIEKRGK